MDLEELISLGEKLALSGDALRAWIEEQIARESEELAEERYARREQAEREERAWCEQAEREARAHERELAIVREIAAIEERNSLLRMRLLEAENAARALASVRVDSVSFMGPGTWSLDELHEAKDSFGSQERASSLYDGLSRSASARHIAFYEEASMPMEKSIDIHKELKNEAKANPKPERSIASYDRMDRSRSFESDAPRQIDAEVCTRIKDGRILIASSKESTINVRRESHFRKGRESSMGSSESVSTTGTNETSGMATEEGHLPTLGHNHSESSTESRVTALVVIGMNEKVGTNYEPRKGQIFASLGGVSHAWETKCENAERESERDVSERTPERCAKTEQSHESTGQVHVCFSDEKSASFVALCKAERIPLYVVELLACRPRPAVSVAEWFSPMLRNLNEWWRHISSWDNGFYNKHSNLTGKGKLCDCFEFQNAFFRSYRHAHVLSLHYEHVRDDNRLVWDAIT